MRRLLAVLCAAGPLWAAVPPTALSPAVRAALSDVCHSPKLASGFAGVLVVAAGERDLTTDRFGLLPYEPPSRPELFAYNADHGFIPASNMKILTTATGLDVLGPEYTFATLVRATREAGADRVASLWLVGGGDPSLSMDGLKRLAEQVKAAGITRVSGSVIADGSRYRDKCPDGWTADDTIWYYGPEVWGLALDRNQVDVYVRPGGTVGAEAQVTVSPASSYVRVRNEVTTASAGAQPDISWDHDLGQRQLVVGGKVPNRTGAVWTQGMAVPDVPLYCATVFTAMLRAAGVQVDGAPKAGTAPADAAQVARLDSPPLGTLIQRLMKRSDNLYAEMLNRELGFRTSGIGSAAAGGAVVREFLTRQGIATEQVRVPDGSGLARTAQVTPRVLAGVLRAMAVHRSRQPWWDALPIAGVDGTMANRLKGTAAENNARLKTGTLTGRTSLSGYVTDRSGDLLIAATVFNGFTCSTAETRELHDRIMAALAGWQR
ncbi:MAG: D-alanyl-D-alanine carboxypeptidase/D-alanyl-D-alanine-endopeptidase [Armatimonadetes bacterium]|nr:D-alanyl-D-alanine carboxypeptidase/D-alanyl-D-alanine-endopeptidase [Armatimonadota bacterium]